jgi:hypothetical protein
MTQSGGTLVTLVPHNRGAAHVTGSPGSFPRRTSARLLNKNQVGRLRQENTTFV